MSKIERYLLDMLDKIDECDNYDDIRKCINKTNYFLRDAVIEELPVARPMNCNGRTYLDSKDTYKKITELFG